MRTLLLGGVAVGLMAAGSAEARTERLRWTHGDPSSVDRYTIYVGNSSGSLSPAQDVVSPPTENGAFYTDITVADDATVFVAVSATGAGGESALSNVRQREAPVVEPPPPPPPATPQAAIQRFVLWDADAEEILDDDFNLGSAVYLEDTPCTTIQVIVNDYLEQASSPGSVRFTVDGEVPECNDVDVTHDDERPYELGAQITNLDFACAAVLQEPGTHSLAATPFDGDGCTGLEGTTRIVTFTVFGAPTAPPAPELGKPGRPTLVPF
jgi:hypothetical protein